jgi:hypothetical protein
MTCRVFRDHVCALAGAAVYSNAPAVINLTSDDNDDFVGETGLSHIIDLTLDSEDEQ